MIPSMLHFLRWVCVFEVLSPLALVELLCSVDGGISYTNAPFLVSCDKYRLNLAYHEVWGHHISWRRSWKPRTFIKVHEFGKLRYDIDTSKLVGVWNRNHFRVGKTLFGLHPYTFCYGVVPMGCDARHCRRLNWDIICMDHHRTLKKWSPLQRSVRMERCLTDQQQKQYSVYSMSSLWKKN